MIKINLISRKFGRLTVIEETKKRDNKDIVYLCDCECGNRKEVPARHLRDGKTKSCGCLANEIRSKNGKLRKITDRDSVLYKGLFAKFKNDAVKRKIKMSLSVKEFIVLVSSNCFYCGNQPDNEFEYSYTKEKIKYNGIDRVDNEKGYALENCVSCCWRCNSAKNNMSIKDFSFWLLKIFNTFGKTKDFIEFTNEMKKNK